MGTMGILYSVTLRVDIRFKLREDRYFYDSWPSVQSLLSDRKILFSGADHVEIYISPYTGSALLTKRIRVPVGTNNKGPTALRHIGTWALQHLIHRSVVTFLLNTFPELVPQFIESALKALVGTYIDDSDKVFLLPAPPDYGIGCEVGFQLKADNTTFDSASLKNVVSRIRSKVEEVKKYHMYLTSPISLRFVKKCDAYLSMMAKGDVCMFEIPVIDGTANGNELLKIIEKMLIDNGGTPHWGLDFDVFRGNDIKNRFPYWSLWEKHYKAFNEQGLFSNAFTKRMDLPTLKPSVATTTTTTTATTTTTTTTATTTTMPTTAISSKNTKRKRDEDGNQDSNKKQRINK